VVAPIKIVGTSTIARRPRTITAPAIQWLVKGAASNVGGIGFSLEDALYAPIRSDPRIQAIIERRKVR